MAALEQSLDVPAIVSRLTGPNPARDQVVARAKELMDKELLALGDDITRHPGDRVHGEAVGRQADRLPARSTTSTCEMGARGSRDRVRRPLSAQQRRAQPRGHPRIRRAARHRAGVPRRPAQRAGTGRHRRGGRDGGVPDEAPNAGQRRRLRHARRGDDAAQRQDRDVRGGRRSRRGHPGAEPLRASATTRPAPGFGTCCLNIDGVKYIFSGAPAHQMTSWNGRNALEARHPSLRQHRQRPQQHPARGPDPGRHHRRRRRPERRSGSRRRGFLHPLSRRGLPASRCAEFVDNAAKAARSRTGTKVKIDHYGSTRDGISVATLGRARLRLHEDVRRDERPARAGKAPGLRGDRQRVERHSRHRLQRAVVDGAEPYLRDGSRRPRARSATRASWSTRRRWRRCSSTSRRIPTTATAVKKEFDGIKALFGEYQAALKKVYAVPNVPEPK